MQKAQHTHAALEKMHLGEYYLSALPLHFVSLFGIIALREAI
jgi:hypothetical protein